MCGDEPAFTQGFAKGLLARCFFRKTTSASLNLKSLSKTHQSSLSLKGGSTAFPKPLFLMEKVVCTRQYESELSLRSFAQPFPSGYRGCTNRPTRCFFSKTYPSFLTLKEGSTSLSKPLPSQKGKDVPTALSIVFTTPSVPLVGDRNGAQTATL